MATVSFDQFLKQTGSTPESVKSLGVNAAPPAVPEPEKQNSVKDALFGKVKSFATDVKESAINRMDRTQEIQNRYPIKEGAPYSGTGNVDQDRQKALQIFGQGAGFASDIIESTIKQIPGAEKALGAIGSVINWGATSDYSPAKKLGELIGQSNDLQEVVRLYDTDQNFKDSVDAVANTVRLGGDVQLVADAVNLTGNAINKIKGVVTGVDDAARATIERQLTTRKTMIDDMVKSGDIQSSPELIKNAISSAKSDIVAALKAEGKSSVASLVNKIDETVFNSIDDFGNAINSTLGNKAGLGGKVSESISSAKTSMGEGFSKAREATSKVARDIVPTKSAVINEQVVKALDFAPGDLDKISRSTGNEAGVYLADKNLIGVNKATTVSNIKDLFDSSYKAVRDEISKVKVQYKSKTIPQYKEALTAIKSKVEGKAGLQEINTEIDTLLKKKDFTLSDIQRTKELLDEHFNLYKVTGDVAEGVEKQGIANVRESLKNFIEKEVEKNGGADIRGLNNDVSTTKTLLETIETRSPKGLTRANIKLGDLGAFGIGSTFGGPAGGLALVLFKKIVESPTVRLRFAKWLDKVDDAEKATVLAELKKGNVPEVVKEVTGVKKTE